MAIIGLKYPIMSKLLTDTPTYDTGFVVGKALAANITIEGKSNILYADDAPVEVDAGFSGGSIELGLDDLTDLVYSTLLGHSFVGGVLTANGTDSAPNVGVGFYTVRVKSSVKTYRATWLYKVQFSEPAAEAATKGEAVEWQTPSLAGTIMVIPTGEWKKQATFATEAEAIAFIENLANIGQPTDKTALAADIVTAQGKSAETYTSASYAVMYYQLQLALAVQANTDATQAQVDAAEDALEAAIAALV